MKFIADLSPEADFIPKKGDVVTFTYSSYGMHPQIVLLRPELTWEYVVHSFHLYGNLEG